MLFRTNIIAMVGGGSLPCFDEKAGKNKCVMSLYKLIYMLYM